VDVFVHWSIFAIAGVMVLASIKQPWVTLAAGLSWMTLLLLHETGHAIVAQRKGCRASAIYLYPIHGLCCFERPWSRFDHCLIAWGGVMAQLIVAIPLIVGVALFGYSRFEPVNAIVAVLGGYSLLVAAFNLLPFGRLDGVLAWRIIPELFQRLKKRRKKREKNPHGWRTY
jgi:Zn-dependent protease